MQSAGALQKNNRFYELVDVSEMLSEDNAKLVPTILHSGVKVALCISAFIDNMLRSIYML